MDRVIAIAIASLFFLTQTPVIADVYDAIEYLHDGLSRVAAPRYQSPKSDALIKEARLYGRLHLDYARVDADQGDLNQRRFRRVRTGTRLDLRGNFRLDLELDWDLNNTDPAYNSLTTAALSYHPSPATRIRLGKQWAAFTVDGATSSKYLLTPERHTLDYNLWFPLTFVPGLTLAHDAKPWRYNAGIFSAGSRSDEFGNFDGGWFTILSLSRDFSEQLSAKTAELRADFVYQDPDANNSFTRPVEFVAALGGRYEAATWGIHGDLAWAQSYDRSNRIYGIALTPFYNLTPRWQLVTRYTGMTSTEANNLLLNRYERQAVPGRGNRYHEGYLGLNWYIHGHQVKLQAGIAYAEMTDAAGDGGAYQGTYFSTAIRIFW